MASLISIAREKYLEAIRSVRPEPPLRWKALVVDEHSKRHLFSVLKKIEILDESVSGIADIRTTEHVAQPDQEAIYILMPTRSNVERIISEFSNGRRQYKKIHLFFVDSLSEELFGLLTSSPAEPFLACLTDLFVNFWPIESQVFSIQEPSYFFTMYMPPRTPQEVKHARDLLMEDLRFTSKMIANLCITLGEFPFIRYYLPSHHPPLGPLVPTAALLPPPPPEGSGRWRTNLARGTQAREYENAEKQYVSKVLATMVQEALEEYQKTNPDFPKKDRQRPRGTLLITDRTIDTVAPFVHEFTYQAMANDLLPIEDGKTYTYTFVNTRGIKEDETVVLSEDDTVWTDVRHMHMREAIDKLMNDFNKFLQENTSFKGDGPVSLDAMKDMLASLPQFQEQRKNFSVHLNMAQECMEIFERKKLSDVGGIEQNCATGLTPENKTPKTLVEDMVRILDDRDISSKDKARIISLYIQYREGVPDEDRRRLVQHARLSMFEQDAIKNLQHLGVRISRGPTDKDVKKKVKARPSGDVEYDLSRYKPVLNAVLEDQVSGKLDQTSFPYVKDSPSVTSHASLRSHEPSPEPTKSLRSQKAMWHKAAPRTGAAPVNVIRERLIVFVAGGMTYSEMRSAYQRSAPLNRDVFVGSTHVVTPEGLLEDLKVLEDGGKNSRSITGGIFSREGPFSTYQQYFDSIYHMADVPPPRSPSPPQPKGRHAAPKMTPSTSYSSMHSSDSNTTNKLEKKKKGFFRF